MARKRSPLVRQFLENVSRKAPQDYEAVIRHFVRRRHGIYVLYRKNRVQYIGLAQNLRNRIRHHLRDRHADSWDRFSVYLTIAASHMKELESLLLRIAKPKVNKAGGRFAKAENLNRQMKRLIQEQQRQELEDVRGTGPRRPKSRPTATVQDDGAGRPVLAAYANRPKLLRGRYKRKLCAHACCATAESATRARPSTRLRLLPRPRAIDPQPMVGGSGPISALRDSGYG